MNSQKNNQSSQIMTLLNVILTELRKIASYLAPLSPNYKYNLDNYGGFNWENIGAKVVSRDHNGATKVVWGGYEFTRRSGSGKFGDAIWFSRSDGKDENGNVLYHRLATFKAGTDAEPIKVTIKDLPATPAQIENRKYVRQQYDEKQNFQVDKFNEDVFAYKQTPQPQVRKLPAVKVEMRYDDGDVVNEKNQEEVAAYKWFVAQNERFPMNREELRQAYLTPHEVGR